MSLGFAGLWLILACGGVAPPTAPAPVPVSAPASAKVTPLCHAACTHIAECGADTYAACVAQCPSASRKDLVAGKTMTCDQLRGGGGGGGGGGSTGAACEQNGTDDCPGTNMCCARGGGGPARNGRPGICVQAGTCYQPK